MKENQTLFDRKVDDYITLEFQKHWEKAVHYFISEVGAGVTGLSQQSSYYDKAKLLDKISEVDIWLTDLKNTCLKHALERQRETVANRLLHHLAELDKLENKKSSETSLSSKTSNGVAS